MAAEWWQVIAALCTGGGAVGTVAGTYLLGQRNAKASENNAKIAATSNFQIAEKTAETTLVAKNIEQLFSELNALRASEHQMREEIHVNSTLITTLREEVRIEKDKNHEIRLEMRNELDNRDREISRLNDALFDKEATQAELIKYIQKNIVADTDVLVIGDIEVKMMKNNAPDEFARRSKWPPTKEEENEDIG